MSVWFTVCFNFSGDSEGLYEQLPVEGGHGPDDGSISPTGFIDGPPLSPSDDSELYASVFNQENGEHLVKPSQIKNRRSLQAGIRFYLILVLVYTHSHFSKKHVKIICNVLKILFNIIYFVFVCMCER